MHHHRSVMGAHDSKILTHPELGNSRLQAVVDCYPGLVLAMGARTPTFNTLAREDSFKNPPKKGSTYNILNEFVTPHIESFNALFDDSGLPEGDGQGLGLISLALKDIGERVVFDGNPSLGAGWGNRMRSEFPPYALPYIDVLYSLD